MGAIRLLLQAHVDRLRLVLGHEMGFLLSALGLLLGIITLAPVAWGLAVSLLALLLGIIAVVRDTRSLHKRWKSKKFMNVAAPFPTREIPFPAAYPSSSYFYFPNRGTALASPAIDKELQTHPIPWRLLDEPYRLPLELRTTAPYVIPKSSKGRVVFNGQVVGLRDDPLPGAAGSLGGRANELRLQVSRYYDFLCSNELCKYQVTDGDRPVFDPIRQLLVGADGRLRTLAESNLADVVGVSTIAFTNDGHLWLVKQSHRNVASEGLLAPTGSGSLEVCDMVGQTSFQGSLINAMERELREETGISVPTTTTITGFGRWLERGAKPEFYGVSLLGVSSSQVQSGRLVSQEKLYVDGHMTEKIDLDSLEQYLEKGGELLESPLLPPSIRDRGSLPLLMALRAAALAHRPIRPST